MSTRFEVLQGLIQELPEDSREYVLRQRDLSLGYAWGFQDCKAMYATTLEQKFTIRDSNDAEEFSYEYAAHTARYMQQGRSFQASIVYAYNSWCDGLKDEAKWQ